VAVLSLECRAAVNRRSHPNNFRLEPGNEVAEREALEACLPRLVCERRLMLDEARKGCLAELASRFGPLPGLRRVEI
jgi:hypothetical protein